MIQVFVIFWTVMIFTSICWYGFLLFYVGFKGGREIREMIRKIGRASCRERVYVLV